LQETDELTDWEQLERAGREVYESGHVFDQDASLGDLQRPAISKSVSVLGELQLTQAGCF